MNRGRELFEYLKQPGSARGIILAPSAPPISHTPTGIEVALNLVLDASDISDTLDHLFAESAPVGGSIMPTGSGTFSFGQKGVGRIRVSYATQRGSYVLAITAIPYDIPKPAEISDSPDVIESLAKIIASGEKVFVAINGPDTISTDTFVYSVLQLVNGSSRNIISILQPELAYLMGHSDSVIMQSELGIDTPDLKSGLAAASRFKANIFYISNIEEEDDHPVIRQTLASRNVVILSSVSQSPAVLADRYAAPISALMPEGTTLKQLHYHVYPKTNGKLNIIASQN